MIKFEIVNEGKNIHHWSDEDKSLLQIETNEIYSDPDGVYDIYPCPYTYKEVDDTPVETDEVSAEELLSMIKEVL